MTKANITEYDNTAANNTDVQDVPLGENLMYPSHVNNAFREIMADLADINDGTVALTSPSADSINITGNITVGGTVDGRDVATDGTKLDGIEVGADVTDTANVTAAGAAMLTGATFTGSITATEATFSGNTSVKLPAGTDAQRPTGVNGMLRYNSDDNQFEGYADGAWGAIAGGGETSLLEYNYTATAGQTTFSGADDNAATLSYTAANLIVTLNGVVLENGTDYTASNGTSVVLTDAASADDELNIVAFKSFTTADMVSATTGGTFNGNVTVNADATVTGDLTVDTNTLHVDSTNNRVGIGTSSPREKLEINGDVIIESSYNGTQFIRNVDVASVGLAGHYLNIGATYNGNIVTPVVLEGQIASDGTANAFNVRLDGSERMRIDSSGNVGIGTSSPLSKLHLTKATDVHITLQSTGDNQSLIGSKANDLYFGQTSSSANIIFKKGVTSGDHPATSGTESMRIDSAGNVYQNVGGTAERGYRVEAGSDDWTYIWGRNNADTSPVFYAQVGNVARAEIESDGSFHSSANSYGGFSDQTYKENIELSGTQWDDIKAVQVKKYSWIYDGLDAPNQLGVIAQDLEASGMGGLVTNLTKLVQQDDGTETAALDDDGNPITYKSVKYSVLYMKAIKALQEAMAKIETLETKVAALEANNV